jgi:hypothetical protein
MTKNGKLEKSSSSKSPKKGGNERNEKVKRVNEVRSLEKEAHEIETDEEVGKEESKERIPNSKIRSVKSDSKLTPRQEV